MTEPTFACEDDAAKCGAELIKLIKLLHLRRNHTLRFDTSGGDKTTAGLAFAVLDVISEHIDHKE